MAKPAKRTYRQRSEEYAKQVSSEIIEQIKKGTAPWQKPWKPGEQSSPSNLATGKAYTGGNSLYLMSRQISEGRGDNRWGTYRQIEAAGGQVRRGEQGTKVLFYQNRTEQPAKDETGKIRKDKEGKTIYEETERSQAVMRQYTVFNVEQTDGLKLPPRESRGRRRNGTRTGRLTKCYAPAGRRCSTSPVETGPYYRMAEDKIVLPDPSQFATRNGYYQTALHEAGHSTGHHDRMNRDTLKEGMAAGFGSPEYAREELRAEISAMMTGEQVGVGHDPQRGAAYVENWVAVLEKDPHEIRRAAGEAQQMTNYLMERAITQEREHPTKTKAELTQEFSHARGPQIGQTPKQPVAALGRRRKSAIWDRADKETPCLIRET